MFASVALAQPGIAACRPPHDKYPFCDTTLSTDARIKDLVGRIHDEDKPNLLTARGRHMDHGRQALPYIGVPSYYWGSNCIHSSMFSNCTKAGRCSTSFPSGPSTAATFDRELVRSLANVVGVETRAGFNLKWVDNGKNGAGLECWGPVININRDPRWGRNGEGSAEDPYLVGEMGVAWARGMQEGEDPNHVLVAATMKHFVANSVEGSWNPDGSWGGKINRHTIDVNITKQNLADFYWPAFRESIRHGKAKGIMCSYNSVNGVPTCLDPLQRAARDAWGFDGYVTSDSDAVEDAWKYHGYVKTAAEASCLALKEGGCDIDSGNTYNDGLRNASFAKACEIDGAVARSMKVRMDLGLFDPPTGPYWSYGEEKIGTDASRELNLRAAGESLVLLRNPTVGGRAVLPLQKGGRVAVVGPHANATAILVQLDSGMICPDDTMACVESPAAAIRRHNGGGSVVVKQGHGLFDSTTDDNTTVADALAAAAAADVVVLGAGIAQCAGHGHGVRPEDCWHGYFGAEGTDRTHIDLPPSQRDFIAQVLALNKPTVIFVLNGGSVALAPELAAPNAAVVEAFYPGAAGAEALARHLYGDANLWGRMPYTMYPAAWVDSHSMLDHDVAATNRTYRYGAPAIVPFGFGLSYSRWRLRRAAPPAAAAELATDGSSADLNVTLTLTNDGPLTGDAIVMAYLAPRATVALQPRPVRSLFDFARARDVAVGASATITFAVNARSLLLVSKDGDRVAAPGEYALSFELGDGATSEAMTVKLVGPQVVVEPFPSVA